MLKSHSYLKNKTIRSNKIFSKNSYTENVFLRKNIPFRSFEIMLVEMKNHWGSFFVFLF